MHYLDDGPPALRTVAEIVKHVPLGEPARALARGPAEPPDLVGRLLGKELFVDAARVLAYALPLRQAVWWSTLCAWHAVDGQPNATQDQSLSAVTRWAREPTEEHRRQAESLSRGLVQCSTDCCVRAAGQAGSARSAGAPFVPAQPLVAARMVLAAVFLASAERAAFDPSVTYRRLLWLGLHTARGELSWNAAAEAQR
jgi:hypothetical protein